MAKLATPPAKPSKPRPDTAERNANRAADRVVARLSKPKPLK